MRYLVSCAAALALVWMTGCSDGGSSVLDDVTVTGTAASAVFGGCGDAAPWPAPDGGNPPCGAPRDFSVEISLQNTSGTAKQVAIVAVTVLDEAGKEIATATITNVVAGGAPFDGELAAAATVLLKIELDSFYLGFTGSGSDTIRYHVVLTIDGKQSSVDSPTTTYSGPPV